MRNFIARIVSSVTLICFAITLLLSTSQVAFAALDSYALAGGAPDALPVVGAASVPISSITISGDTDDDFGNNELIRIYINSGAFPGVVFDDTVGLAAINSAGPRGTSGIGGSCTFNSATDIGYSGDGTNVSITINDGVEADGCSANDQTITIVGLKVKTLYNHATVAAQPFVSVDNMLTSAGSPVATSTLSTLTASAGDLNGAITLGANSVVGVAGNTTLTLTLNRTLNTNDTIYWAMPANFSVATGALVVSSQTIADPGALSCVGGALPLPDVGLGITCTVTAGTAPAATGTITVSGVTALWDSAGATNVTNLKTHDSRIAGGVNGTIGSDATVAVDDTSVGALASANVEPGSLTASATSAHTVSFTTHVAIPNLGIIFLYYNGGFNLAGANGTIATIVSGLDGDWTASVSGQGITLTQTGGGSTAAGAISFSIPGIVNPSSAGSGGTYRVTTKTDTALAIETDDAVSADTIAPSTPPPPPENSGGVGGGYTVPSVLFRAPVTTVPVVPPVVEPPARETQAEHQVQEENRHQVQQPVHENPSVQPLRSAAPVVKPVSSEIPDPNPKVAYTESLQDRKDFQKYEQKYDIQIPNGIQDSDHDGKSDILEFKDGTNPTKPDTDGDGLTDTEEKDFGTSPTNAKDPADPTNPIGHRPPLVTNFQNTHYTSDAEPLIKGLSTKNSDVQVLLTNTASGQVSSRRLHTDEHGVFVFLPEKPLPNGTYKVVIHSLKFPKKPVSNNFKAGLIVAHAQDNSDDMVVEKTSKPMYIHVNSTLDIPGPNLKKLADADINEDVLKGLSVEIKDNKPVLTGKVGFNHEVIATWSSIVMTSALIADTTAGDFSVQPGKSLPIGHHEVYVQSIRPKDKVTSKTMKVSFDITAANTAENVKVTPVDSSGNQNSGSALKNAAEETTASQPNIMLMVGGGVLLLMVVGGILFVLRCRKPPENGL